MAEENKLEEFTVDAGETIASFDLDYSQKEIEDSQKLCEEDDHFINRETLRTLVTEHPFFARFFHWMKYDTPYVRDDTVYRDESGKKIRRENKGNAIPAELLSFFKLYMMEVRSRKWKSTTIRKNKVPEGMEESFHKRLLSYAQAEEKKSDLQDSEIYWTRHLYENECFQKTAVRDLWDEEYTLRAKGLYEKVKLLPPAQQLEMFYNVVTFLDSQIASASIVETNKIASIQTQDVGLEVFLDEFPKQVISCCRKRTVSPESNKRVQYTVENIPLVPEKEKSDNIAAYTNIPSLKKAMIKIRGNINGSLKLKKVARAAYLRRLNQKTSKSQFQLDYETSRAYLNGCTGVIRPEALRKKIVSRAAEYYGSAFRGQIAMPGCYISDPSSKWRQSEIDRLIEEYVSRHYSAFFYQYEDYLTFINNSRDEQSNVIIQMVDMINSYGDDPKKLEDETLYQKRLEEYMDYLRVVMPNALYNIFTPGLEVNGEHHQMLIDHMVELCIRAFQKLGIDPMEWANAEVMKSVLDRYNGEVFPDQGPKLLPGFTKYDVILRKAMITIKVGEAVDDCCRETEQNILALTSAIK